MSEHAKKLAAAIAAAIVVSVAGTVAVMHPERADGMKPRAVLDALSRWPAGHIVDLTHGFAPGIPHREILGDEIIEPLFAYAPGAGRLGTGAQLDRFTLVGQWGTHVDAPVHFGEGMRSLEKIEPGEMILPLVVLDIHEQAAADADYAVNMNDVRHWEQRHGPIPIGAFVALRTDWYKRWPDAAAFFNDRSDGVSHYPGWSLEVLKYVDEQRGAKAIGHETPDTDPGATAEQSGYALESYHLRSDRYQIEMMTNLDRVPQSGAVIIATWPRATGASGFPARVLALVP